MAISALSAPFRFARLNIRHFSSLKCGFWRLSVVATGLKVASFAAFLLPFKAMMLVITPPSQVQVAGITASTYHVAGSIVAVALAAFVSQWLLRSLEARLFDQFFLRAAALRAGGEDEVSSLEPDAAEAKLLRSTVGMVSAALLGTALIILAVIVMPVSFFLLSAIIAAFFIGLATDIKRREEGSSDLSWTGQVHAFAAMVGVLAFFGVLLLLGYEIGILAGLFVFIATRRLSGNLAEIASFVGTYSDPTVPKFLRRSAQVEVPASLRSSPVVPDYLRRATQREWFEGVMTSALPDASRVHAIAWRNLPARTHRSFMVEAGAKAPSRYLVNVYRNTGMSAFKRERLFHSVCAEHPLGLRLISEQRGRDHAALVYEANEFVDGDRDFFSENVLSAVEALWREPPPAIFEASAHPADFLVNITANTLDMLACVASDREARDAVDKVATQLAAVKAVLSAAPQGLHNPEINASTLGVCGSDQTLKATSWGRFDVEPIGCLLWHFPSKSQHELDALAGKLREARSDCAQLKGVDLQFNASVFGLAKTIQNGSLASAIAEAKTVARLLDASQASGVGWAAE